jgi:hypothetical protein
MDASLSSIVGGASITPQFSGMSHGALFINQVIVPKLMTENHHGQRVSLDKMCLILETMSNELANDPNFQEILLVAPSALVGSPPRPITWADLISAWYQLGDWESSFLAKKGPDVEIELNKLLPKVRIVQFEAYWGSPCNPLSLLSMRSFFII